MLATYLQRNLPFNLEVLKSLTFLDITNAKDCKEQQAVDMALKLPNVIPESECERLKMEIRLYNLLPSEDRPADIPVDEAWQFIRKLTDHDNCQSFPLLSSLAAACCTIYHGNADVERFIGKSHDIDHNDRRCSLSGKYTCIYIYALLISTHNILVYDIYLYSTMFTDPIRRSLLLTRSFLSSRQLSSTTVEISHALLDKGFQAHSESVQHAKKVAAEKASAEMVHQQDLERQRILKEVENNQKRKCQIEELKQLQMEVRNKLKYVYYSILYFENSNALLLEPVPIIYRMKPNRRKHKKTAWKPKLSYRKQLIN